MKNRRALAFSLIAAVLAFVFMQAYISGVERELSAAYENMDVLVATRNIPAGITMDDAMVRPTQVPRKFLTKTAVDNPDFLFGHMTAVPILEGEQVTQTKLLSIEEAGLARKIPAGYRAVSIAVDRVSGVSNQIRPGNHVDIVGVFNFGAKTGVEMKTVTIYQNVEVLSVGDDLSQATPKMTGEQRDLFAQWNDPDTLENPFLPGKYRDIALALPPQEAQRLVLAQEIGELRLTLRRKTQFGEDQVALEATNPRKAFGLGGNPLPKKTEEWIWYVDPYERKRY